MWQQILMFQQLVQPCVAELKTASNPPLSRQLLRQFATPFTPLEIKSLSNKIASLVRPLHYEVMARPMYFTKSILWKPRSRLKGSIKCRLKKAQCPAADWYLQIQPAQHCAGGFWGFVHKILVSPLLHAVECIPWHHQLHHLARVGCSTCSSIKAKLWAMS